MKTPDCYRYLLATLAACLTAWTAAIALGQPPPGGEPGMEPCGGPLWQMGPGGPEGPHMKMGGGPPGIRGEMMKHLYPVELVRRHADEIELSESQYEKLRSTVVKVKGEVEKISWDMDREAQKLVDLVAKGAKSEEIYAQMDRVFEYENKIKKLHLGLLLSVRDILTDKQRKQLDQIRQQRRGGEGAPGARRGKVRK